MSVGTTAAIAAGIGAAGAIGGAAISSHAAGSAADKEKQAGDAALALQREEDARQQANIQPLLNAGYGALNQLQGDPTLTSGFSYDASNLQNDPGYQFQLSEGQKALQRNQAATGITGGAAAKAIERYSQGLADTTYNQAYNRAFNTFEANQGNRRNTLLSLAQLGQTGVSQAGQAGANYANNASDITQGIGNADAASSIASGNALAGGLTGSANALQLATLLNRSSYNPKSIDFSGYNDDLYGES